MAATPAGAIDCTESQPVVTIATEIPPPQLDNALAQSELQAIPTSLPEDRRWIGLYHAELFADFRVRLIVERDGEETCARLMQVDVVISMPRRVIYVARERRPGTCDYDAVLGHERKHEAADDTVLAEHVPQLKKPMLEVARRVSAQGGRVGNEERAQRRLDEELRNALKEAARRLERERAARHRALDTPREYARVNGACDPLRNR